MLKVVLIAAAGVAVGFIATVTALAIGLHEASRPDAGRLASQEAELAE